MGFFKTLESVCEEMGAAKGDVHPGLPRAAEFRMLGLGGGAITIEEGLFLSGLLWVEKPDVVIELGTSYGASAVMLGAALKDLGKGRLITVDKRNSIPTMASKLVGEYDLPVEFVCGEEALAFLQSTIGQINKGCKCFVFSDTEIKERPEEVKFILDNFPHGTLIAVHDTSDLHPIGPMKLKSEIGNRAEVFDFPSPRGISILRV